MQKIILTTFLSLAFIASGFAQIPFEYISLKEAMAKAKKEKVKIFVDVYTSWCGPCKLMDKEVFSDKAVGERMKEEYVSVKVDYEKSEFRKDFYSYQIKGYPTMLILDDNGIELGRIYGRRSLQEFNLELDKYSTEKKSEITKAAEKLKDSTSTQDDWRKSISILGENYNLLQSNNLLEVYKESQINYFKKFSIENLNDSLDRQLFYSVKLDLKYPAVQSFLKDSSEYAKNYLHRSYMILQLQEEYKNAKKKKDKAAVQTKAEKYYEQYALNFGNDVESKEEFLEEVSKENNKVE